MKVAVIVFASFFSLTSLATTMTLNNNTNKESRLMLAFKHEPDFQEIKAVAPHSSKTESIDAFLNKATSEDTWVWISVRVGTQPPIQEAYCDPALMKVKDIKLYPKVIVSWNGARCYVSTWPF